MAPCSEPSSRREYLPRHRAERMAMLDSPPPPGRLDLEIGVPGLPSGGQLTCSATAPFVRGFREQLTCGHQFFSSRIDGEIQPLQRSGAEELQIARLGKNHFVNSEILVQTNNGEAHAASNSASVGH